jgi:inner membrane protein
MTDLRMGLECAYVFNFVVAEKTVSGLQLGSFQQFSQRPDLSEINNIFKRIWDPEVDLTPTLQRKEGC